MIAWIAGYTFWYSPCNMLVQTGCSVHATPEHEEVDFMSAPTEGNDRYNDPEYIQAREAVEREVERKKQEELSDYDEDKASLERATQKAIELREEKNNTLK